MSDDQLPDAPQPPAEPDPDASPFPLPPLETQEKGLDPPGKETRDGA